MVYCADGASAVLLFGVPSSPLAQPWSIVGGNVLSALIGVTVGLLVPDTAIACGRRRRWRSLECTFALSASAGGAVALTAILAAPAYTVKATSLC